VFFKIGDSLGELLDFVEEVYCGGFGNGFLELRGFKLVVVHLADLVGVFELGLEFGYFVEQLCVGLVLDLWFGLDLFD
jgi:hypothetical protein